MPDEHDKPSAEAKWIGGFGWCDRPFVNLTLHPVEQPTEAQIRYVRGIFGYGDKNFLEIHEILRKGRGVAFGILLPEEVERLDVRLRELGLTYSVTKDPTYRPIKYDQNKNKNAA